MQPAHLLSESKDNAKLFFCLLLTLVMINSMCQLDQLKDNRIADKVLLPCISVKDVFIRDYLNLHSKEDWSYQCELASVNPLKVQIDEFSK